MHEMYADFMKLDEWPGISGKSVPIAPVEQRSDLSTLDGQIVTLISFDLRAQARVVQHEGWWFGVLTSAGEENPNAVAS